MGSLLFHTATLKFTRQHSEGVQNRPVGVDSSGEGVTSRCSNNGDGWRSKLVYSTFPTLGQDQAEYIWKLSINTTFHSVFSLELALWTECQCRELAVSQATHLQQEVQFPTVFKFREASRDIILNTVLCMCEKTVLNGHGVEGGKQKGEFQVGEKNMEFFVQEREVNGEEFDPFLSTHFILSQQHDKLIFHRYLPFL